MKYFRTLDKDRVIKILEEYRTAHGEYPTTNEFVPLRQKYPGVIPSVKWIQNKGGVIWFYQFLGLKYTDARTGARRANVATDANRKSQSLDVELSLRLVAAYGDANVHWQSPYNKTGTSLHRADFKVYRPDGTFFFVDQFFPKDIASLQGCVNIKMAKLKEITVEKNAMVYFVSCNEEDISSHTISRYLQSRKSPMPRNIKLIHISDIDTELNLI
jgi:hypothetical protein